MKKNIFISAALACVAFSSCQQENLGGNDAEFDGFRVHTEDVTKAVLDGVKVVFEDEDAIDIYADGAETPAVYSYDKANDLFLATGTEAEGEEYTAIFPSTATNPSRSTIYISNRQVATVNSFPKNSMYMAGVSTSKEIALKHLTGLWEIDLLPQYDGQKLVRASLAVNGDQMINGNFEINWDDYSLTYVDGGTRSILLADISYVMTAGETVKLYFALPEGKYEGGFTFTATMTDGTTMEVNSPSTINIARGQITKVKNDVAYRLFASGTGTETDPYVIKGANHWNNMVRKVNTDATNYASAYYKVAADIDFENDPVTPIKNFSGVIDGGNYTLKNAKIGDGTASHQAFFYMLNGTVKNLNFDKITVTGGNATGAASSAAVISAGNSSLAFTIDNCHVSNSTIISGPHSGDKGGSYAAGLVGRCNNADAIIRNCSVTNSTISGEVANIGALIGYAKLCVLENVISTGNTITANGQYAGGVVGNIDVANVSGVTASNNVVNASKYVGGLSGGMTSGEACNIVSSGNKITSGSSDTGGVVGHMIGGTIDSVLSSGNTVESGTSYTGGVVGVMEAATLINASSKNNVCIVNQVTCGGIVGYCTSDAGKIVNVFSDGNTVKSKTHANLLYLGLIMGTNGTAYTTLLANSLVLTGTAEYVYNPYTSGDKSYNFAGGIGVALGYGSATVESGYYFQNYRSRFDSAYSVDAVNAGYTTNGYRFAVGVKQNNGTQDSRGGTDGSFTVSKETALTDGTVLNALNAWVEANKTTYPTLKSWAARTTGKAFPEILLEESAASGVNSLNIVESNY